MNNSAEALKEITKIGNYAIPTFGAVLTAIFCINSFSQSAPDGQAIVINFALYTLSASFVSYAHRLSFLRYRKYKEKIGDDIANLPLLVVLFFIFIHLSLIALLSYKLWPLSVISGAKTIEINFLDIFSKLTIPVIGFLGVYIAWRQWNTAAYRFRLDLFDKRFSIYEAILDFILSIRGGGIVHDYKIDIFKDKTLSARFVFDNKVADYINEIKEKAYDVQTFASEAEGMAPGEEKVAKLRQASEARKWLYEQIKEKSLYKKLGHYLKITSSSLGGTE